MSTESSSDLLYVVRVNVSNEYDDIEYRIVCNWDDFGKEQSGRPSPPSAVVKPATHCICKLVHQLYICQWSHHVAILWDILVHAPKQNTDLKSCRRESDRQRYSRTHIFRRTAGVRSLVRHTAKGHLSYKMATVSQCEQYSSHSVNGDIAIQWEWSKFDPSQNLNSLTDYDKTLHNSLRPRDEHATQNLCQSALRERLAKYVKYKASLFYFYFFPGLAYWSNPVIEFHSRWFKTRVVT